jgi:hypothetical protein
LDSKGQAVHDDLNTFVSCLIAVELTGGSKLIDLVLDAVLCLLDVYMMMHILPDNCMLTLIVRNWLLVRNQTCGHYVIGLFQNLVYVLAFLFVTSWAKKGDTVPLKNSNTVDIA